MKFTVTKLRERGKRLNAGQIANTRSLSGDLVTCSIASTKGYYKVAELKENASGGLKETLITLYEPEIVQISGSCLLLRGIEKADGRAFLQEWRCEQV